MALCIRSIARDLLEKLEERRLLATVPAGFTDQAWGASVTNGTQMEFAPDGRLFVCTQDGTVRVIDQTGTLLGAAALTLSVDSLGERGLLGIAFDPAFNAAAPGVDYVYLYYTVPSSQGGPFNRIARFEVNGNTIALGTQATILNLNGLGPDNHNGGGLHFGPDGKLYVGAGENANGNNAQSIGNLLGKVLRVNPDPANPIPTDNPTSFPGIAGSPTGNNRAIWAVGLRNPFTSTWTPDGRYLINDVGAETWEEIDQGIAGRNFGWPSTEGDFNQGSFPNFTRPVYSYQHGGGLMLGTTIAGGAFYDSNAAVQFPAPYDNKYFFGEFGNNWIGYIDLAAPPAASSAPNFASGASDVVDLKVGQDGALYWLGRSASGGVRRIIVNPPTPAVTNSQFQWDNVVLPNPPHRLQFTFNTNVRPSLATSDLTLQNLTTSTTVPTGSIAMSYDFTTNRVTFTFPGFTNGILPDGNYRATLTGAGVLNALGNPLPANVVFNFFVLAGDANHNGIVNVNDFTILAGNFNQSNRIFSQGDFNYDGKVNINDFTILAGNFNEALSSASVSQRGGSSSFGEKEETDGAADALRDLLV